RISWRVAPGGSAREGGRVFSRIRKITGDFDEESGEAAAPVVSCPRSRRTPRQLPLRHLWKGEHHDLVADRIRPDVARDRPRGPDRHHPRILPRPQGSATAGQAAHLTGRPRAGPWGLRGARDSSPTGAWAPCGGLGPAREKWPEEPRCAP